MISAEVICDSVSPAGKRLTTFKLRYPKFIHGEFMTHRVLSRNASSSRAIPTAKLIEEVRNDALRAAPIWWGKNQAGMQAAEELAGWDLEVTKASWGKAATDAADHAERMLSKGAHKQIVNRILEPFSHISVVATATEWGNFFGLRLHRMAQPEMRALAEEMWKARQQSIPNNLVPGEWHLPFIDDREWTLDIANFGHDVAGQRLTRLIKASVARCARVSYDSLVSPSKRSTIEEDLATYAKLNLPGTASHDPLQPIHASPAEHQATPDEWLSNYNFGQGCWENPEHHGNFIGWRQFRKTLDGESCAPLPKEYQS